MTFLTGLLTSFLKMLLSFLWDKGAAYEKEKAAQEAAQKEIHEKNDAARQQLENAQTKEERDAAASRIFDSFDN